MAVRITEKSLKWTAIIALAAATGGASIPEEVAAEVAAEAAAEAVLEEAVVVSVDQETVLVVTETTESELAQATADALAKSAADDAAVAERKVEKKVVAKTEKAFGEKLVSFGKKGGKLTLKHAAVTGIMKALVLIEEIAGISNRVFERIQEALFLGIEIVGLSHAVSYVAEGAGLGYAGVASLVGF